MTSGEAAFGIITLVALVFLSLLNCATKRRKKGDRNESLRTYDV